MKNLNHIQTKLNLNQHLGFFIWIGIMLLMAACSNDRKALKASKNTAAETSTAANMSLYDTIWQVEDIDNAGIIDRSHITMQLSGEGQIAGSTGCNRYFGSVVINGSSFLVENIGSTRKACVPAIMHQEQQFQQAINSVQRYEMDGEFINLYDEDNSRRVRLIRNNEKTNFKPTSLPQDKIEVENQQAHTFSCDTGLKFEFRFVGPETLMATVDADEFTLQREPTATGAKYFGPGIIFWNKGNEALLEYKGRKYFCEK